MAKLAVGDKAPDFQLDSSEGGQFSLAKAAGKWLVLYFYPKDDTPGCTKEACNFRDRIKDYQKVGALIYGVSGDDLKSHAKFIEKYHLPFPLLADPEHKALEAYSVWKEKNMYGRIFLGIERTTFVIDPQGKIAKIYPRVKVDKHHEEVLAFIRDQL
jgi:peroxiredoxin Q/BCP